MKGAPLRVSPISPSCLILFRLPAGDSGLTGGPHPRPPFIFSQGRGMCDRMPKMSERTPVSVKSMASASSEPPKKPKWEGVKNLRVSEALARFPADF
jgi:hypothetical protein